MIHFVRPTLRFLLGVAGVLINTGTGAINNILMKVSAILNSPADWRFEIRDSSQQKRQLSLSELGTQNPEPETNWEPSATSTSVQDVPNRILILVGFEFGLPQLYELGIRIRLHFTATDLVLKDTTELLKPEIR